MKKRAEGIDGLRLRLARLTVGLTIHEAAKKLQTKPLSIIYWEHERVHAKKHTISKVNKWIANIEAKHGPLALPNRGGEDIAALCKRFTRKFIAKRLGISATTVSALKKRKTFELKPGVFELVKRIKELELVQEMPDTFTKEEMQRLKWLITKEPRKIRKLAETGPFCYWSVIRWMDGTCWPRRGKNTEKLRAWIKKLERMNR